jgi:hypothetical protein
MKTIKPSHAKAREYDTIKSQGHGKRLVEVFFCLLVWTASLFRGQRQSTRSMKFVYLTPARREYKRKLARIALRPFTTHSISDFIEDIERLEAEILLHPGLRKVAKAPAGYCRSGPSKVYSYFLIYRIHEGDAIIVAVSAPTQRPLYWRRRKIQASP